MPKPLTIFLCSTYTDLADERQRILDAVRRLQLQHDSMEFFGARADLPIETCLTEVRRSDILVVVVGHRYGSLVPELGISFSEAEYREGRRLGKPCLVYMRDENAPIAPRNFERDAEKLRLLEAWKNVLTSQHTVATFFESGALAVQVAADLSRTIQALNEAESTRTEREASNEDSSYSEIQGLVRNALTSGIPYSSLLSSLRRTVSEMLAASGERKPIVFLSHSATDKPIVREMAAGLQSHGIDVWLEEAEIKLGESLATRIEHGLDSSDFVAFFLSKASMSSTWVRQELNATISRQVSGNRGAIVLPILLEDTEIPPLLRDVVYLDMRKGSLTTNIERLVAAIRERSLQRLHTYETTSNRYFNPPSDIRRLGRALKSGDFGDLVKQLVNDEVLFGLYTNQAGALVGAHLHSKSRLEEMERLWAPAEGYFALNLDIANSGLSEKLPRRQ